MLKLPNDGEATGTPLMDHLLGKGGPAEIVAAIAAAVPELAQRLAAGRIYGDPAALVGTNDSGDAQKALDVGAHLHMLAALAAAGVRRVLSEEDPHVATLNPEGAWDVAIDPIDGSGSIGIGAPLLPRRCVETIGLFDADLPFRAPSRFVPGRPVAVVPETFGRLDVIAAPGQEGLAADASPLLEAR